MLEMSSLRKDMELLQLAIDDRFEAAQECDAILSNELAEKQALSAEIETRQIAIIATEKRIDELVVEQTLAERVQGEIGELESDLMSKQRETVDDEAEIQAATAKLDGLVQLKHQHIEDSTTKNILVEVEKRSS